MPPGLLKGDRMMREVTKPHTAAFTQRVDVISYSRGLSNLGAGAIDSAQGQFETLRLACRPEPSLGYYRYHFVFGPLDP